MRWKNNAECAVLFTFDVDAEAMWEARAEQGMGDYDKPPVMSLGEFGSQVAAPRILDLLDEYNIPAGFFVPGRTAERHPDLVNDIHEAGHEIGHHGYSHKNLVTMSAEEELDELERANEVFEELIGKTPDGFRSPAADMSKRTLNCLIDVGFEYESSMMGSDLPYFVEGNGGDIVELPFYWSQDDAPYFNFNMYPRIQYQSGLTNPEHVFDVWSTEFDGCYKRGLLFHLVMHPQIIGRPHRMELLEEIIQYIRSHSNVWIARPKEVAQHWRETVSDERNVRSV